MPEVPSVVGSRAEVVRALTARIGAGEALLEMLAQPSQPSHELADEADHHERRWRSYNELLLRRSFSTGELEERYQDALPTFVIRSAGDKVRAAEGRIRAGINELQAVVEQLELMDDATDVPAAASDADRDRYFARLCEVTKGRVDQVVASKDLARDLGLDDGTRSDIEDFLRSEGLIEFRAFGPQISLTHAGRLRCEGKASASVAAPPGQQIIVMGDAVGSTFQQAGDRAAQVAETGDVFVSAGEWVAEFRARLEDGTLALPAPAADEARDHIDVVESELREEKPRRQPVRASLRALGRLAEEAGGELVATGLLNGLPALLNALS